jgi:signal transduction histidine kinase/ActR/RegA family two-component response regulator
MLLAAAAIVPMLLVVAAAGYTSYLGDLERISRRTLDSASHLAAEVERELRGTTASLQVLALSPMLQHGDVDGFRELALLFRATQPPGATLSLVDAAGRTVLAINSRQQGMEATMLETARAQSARPVFTGGDPVISNLAAGADDRTAYITVSVPVMRQGSVAYDLSLALPWQAFASVLANQHIAPAAVATIFDRDGHIVARYHDDPRVVGRQAERGLLNAVLDGRDEVFSGQSGDGEAELVALSHSRPSGWSVAVTVPEATLRAPLLRSLRVTSEAGLLGLMCSLLVATLLAQRVMGPMRALERMAAAGAADGEPASLGLREVDAVASALRASLRARQAAMAAMAALNEALEERVRQEIASRIEVQERLAQAQRMEALGQLAGGIAHDFNNVLQAVTGGLSLIQRRAENPEAVRRLAGMASDAADRGAAITGRLLTFARRGELKAVPIAARGLLESLREMLAPTLGASILVQVEAPCDLPPLLADKAQLETVLVNLSVNARDAMPGGGTLVLSAQAETLASPQIGMRPEAGAHALDLRAGAYVRLVLADTGIGMDANTLARASEPFFTTKGPGHGTGLGLAMARGFALQSGGGFSIASTPGAGTRVSLWFPQAVSAAAPPRAAGPPALPAKPALRVLMVDDDNMVREALAGELEDRGFHVTTASDGLGALALVDGGEAMDVLVTDFSMPGMNGLSLIREVRRRRPDAPALLLTGYAEAGAEASLTRVPDRLTTLLRKPISGEDLAARVTGLGKEENLRF